MCPNFERPSKDNTAALLTSQRCTKESDITFCLHVFHTFFYILPERWPLAPTSPSKVPPGTPSGIGYNRNLDKRRTAATTTPRIMTATRRPAPGPAQKHTADDEAANTTHERLHVSSRMCLDCSSNHWLTTQRPEPVNTLRPHWPTPHITFREYVCRKLSTFVQQHYNPRLCLIAPCQRPAAVSHLAYILFGCQHIYQPEP